MAKPTLKQIINILLTVIFLLFAAVQFNDPDPVRWILVYGFVAVICGFAAFGKSNSTLIWVGIIIIACWMAAWFPEFLNWISIGEPNLADQMKAETPSIEFAREFLGLLIAGLCLGWQLLQHKKK